MSVKEKALQKMLNEMMKKHTETEDRIHNWLCQQEDDLLFTGVLKAEKTISKAVEYCSSTAQKLSVDKRSAMVPDDTVYQWVKDYFIKYEEPKKTEMKAKIPQTTASDKPTQKSFDINKKKFSEWEGEQLDMFADYDN